MTHPTALRRFGPPGARPLLALHCALAHGGAWAPLAGALPGVELIAPDLPGHGDSAAMPEGADFHELTTGVAAELAARQAPVDLIGHSFGATVALRLALERPELVRSLTLVEPVLFAAARGTPAWAECHAKQAAVARLLRQDPAAAAALFHAEWGAGLPFAALPARQREYLTARMPLVVAPGPLLMDDLAGLLRPGGLEGIGVPVLLAEGGRSPPVVAAILDTLAARLPDVRRLTVAGAAHMLPLTHPAPLAQAMQDLLARA
ncbi:alpha/beta fold hydrolase [Pseudogemmobacter humi]|uniref:2-succinyl-6-hydroxy-2, 4-cyclohexadiene-1-carboxylate synthase n=1 Tax=Pseudogemmobacter humi TaxID=2483812 RepID=A0A3P5WX74_9RHOB|nr:alpha/beta fold hydrolase [Pseudogemmobacter humi]VDC26042.1 2-succinyl-6-hydroxy-2, 4-cyclohexadiene-1-carboxylate synthase [Pseudogemmobacter humi]